MMFWLTGADEPVVQNVFLTNLRILKKFKKKIGCPHKKCLSMQKKKNRIEKTFCVAGIKKTKNVTDKVNLEHRDLSFLHQP